MNDYLAALQCALRSRGRARRRFLTECRDHLDELAREVGEGRGIALFGAPGELAAAFDAEVATRRGVFGTWVALLGVTATGVSTLALIDAADAGAKAPTAWAVLCLGFAQVAAVCAALAGLQALRLRRIPGTPADVALLCRRSAFAIVAAGIAMFSAGAALPGSGSAALLLAGPAMGATALVAVARCWRITGRLDGARERPDRSPFAEIHALTGIAVPAVGPAPLAFAAAGVAFVRDLGERGSSTSGSLVIAAIEAAMVLVAYAALRQPLGLRGAPFR